MPLTIDDVRDVYTGKWLNDQVLTSLMQILHSITIFNSQNQQVIDYTLWWLTKEAQEKVTLQCHKAPVAFCSSYRPRNAVLCLPGFI